jgi:uncharacterized protein (DUF433 family)
MTTATTYQHIVLDEAGTAWVEGANTKVVEIVMDVKAYGWSPEEIHLQHPHLSLGQIHSALAYYWDNVEDIERDIARRSAEVEAIRAELGPSDIRQKISQKRNR